MSKSKTFSINQRVSELLAEERQAAGLTQAEVSTKLNKPQSFISKYESGQRSLSVGDVISVCKAIGLKPSKFFKFFD